MMVLWEKISQTSQTFDKIITISCVLRHQAVFGIVRYLNSSFFISCPIWLKFCTWVNLKVLTSNLSLQIQYKYNLSEKSHFLTNWKFWPITPQEKHCHGIAIGCCQHKTISNDSLYIKFIKFYWPTTSHFRTARQKPLSLGEGAQFLNRVKSYFRVNIGM